MPQKKLPCRVLHYLFLTFSCLASCSTHRPANLYLLTFTFGVQYGVINMTGDPNQKTKFGFECSYPSPAMDLPRFNERSTTTNLSASGNATENPMQCLFGTNNSSQFPISNAVPSTSRNISFSNSYLFPQTPTLNTPPPPPINFIFPFSPVPSSSEKSTSAFVENCNIPESSGSVSHSSMFSAVEDVNPFQLKWNQNMKPIYNFPSKLYPVCTNSSNLSMPKVSHVVFGCKRKTESPPLPPLKQHITEERMAEHMSRLHISSETPVSIGESPPVRQQRLYMCEEMQRLQAESIIPAQILERVNRPCTALVPWRPPIVPPIVKENNNNEEEPDNNQSEQSSSNVMDTES